MNVSEQEAQESLASIDGTISRTRKAVMKTQIGPILVLWGMVWTACYLASHFFPKSAGGIFTAGASVGAAGIAILLLRESRRGPATRNPLDKSLTMRVNFFWLLAFAYAFTWIALLKPQDGIRMNAFLCMVALFGLIVMGLWFCSWSMVVVGIAGTITTLVGVYAIHHMYYCVWMAVTFGGGMLGTGLYMLWKWR